MLARGRTLSVARSRVPGSHVRGQASRIDEEGIGTMAGAVRKAKTGAMTAEVAADADIRSIIDGGGATVETAAGAVAEK